MLKKSKGKGKKRNKGVPNPSESVIEYNGPIDSFPAMRGERTLSTKFVSWAPIALISTGGGLYNTVFPIDLGTANDYASLAAVYDEYRVLGAHMKYLPVNRYNRTAAEAIGPGFVVLDHDDGTALASLALASNYESAKFVNLSDPWKSAPIRMHSIENAVFTTTATPVTRQWIKPYFEALGATKTYGNIFVTAIVQFRGRD